MVLEASVYSDFSPPLRAYLEADCQSKVCVVKQSSSTHGNQKAEEEKGVLETYPSETDVVPPTSSV